MARVGATVGGRIGNWGDFLALAYRQASYRERIHFAWLTGSRILVGFCDLLLAAAMYALFILLQGGKPVHHPWWTPQTTLSAALATTSLVLLRSGLEILSLRSVVESVQEIYAKLVLRLVRGYTEMQWEQFVECNRSDIFHHAIHNAREVSYCYQLSIELAAAGTVVSAMLCALIYQSVYVAVTLVLIGTIFYWIHRTFIRERLREASAKKENALQFLQRTLADMFSVGKEIRTYLSHDFFYKRVAEQLHSVSGGNLRLMILPQISRNMADQGVVLAFLALVIAVELRHGNIHQMLALLVFYFVLSRRLLPLVSQISFMASQTVGSLESVWKVQEELSRCARFRASQPTDELPRSGLVLELEDVSFDFGAGTKILRKVFLYQRTGEVVVVRGLSGSGKSTLLNIIAGVIRPCSGVIRIDRDRIAYVPQEITLLDDTVRSNLLFGLSRRADGELMRALKAAELDDFISAQPMGLDTRVGDNGVRLSGGQRQRLGIARAMLRQPKLLLLDEATSALDRESETRVLAKLRQCEAAILLISHRTLPIGYRDREFRLLDGRLVQEESSFLSSERQLDISTAHV